jgi:DNA-binding transcriptional MerR regulator
MKPEYRTLDPVGTTGETGETLASLLAGPSTTGARTWTIGELARECDVTLRALRFYEGKGLLAPSRDGAARLYGAEDVRRLKAVLRLKRIGFSLVEIREMLDRLFAPTDVRDRAGRLLGRVEAQVAVLEEQRRDVELALATIGAEIEALRRHAVTD